MKKFGVNRTKIKNMNATLNIISPLCVIQTLLTLLKNWCLSPPLYLLLQSRGRFLTVLFISFVTDLFFENPIRKILDFFRNYKAKKLILFSITKVNQKVFFGWLWWGFRSWIPEKWWIKHISILQNILIYKTSIGVIHTIYEWNSQVLIIVFHSNETQKSKGLSVFPISSFFSSHSGTLLYVLKFIYSEKATKFCEIFTLLLTGTT